MSNLSILDQNIIHGLNCAHAESLYLRLREKMSPLEAEKHAYTMVAVEGLVGMAADQSGLDSERNGSLLQFFEDRIYHWAKEPSHGC